MHTEKPWKRSVWLAVALGAAGCSSSGSGNSTTVGDLDASQGRSVEICSPWLYAGDAAALQGLFDVHKTRYPNDHIVNTPLSPQDAYTTVANRIQAGNPPELFQSRASMVPSWFSTVGATSLQPLNEFLALESQAGVLSNIFPDIVTDITVDGKIYSMPVGVTRDNALFYNKQVFATHQLNPPTTIAELLTVCKTLRTAGVTPLGGLMITWIWDDVLAGVMGIDAFYTYNSPGGKGDETTLRSAIDTFADVWDSCIDNLALPDELAASLISGQTAMVLNGDWSKSTLEQLGWTPGVDFGVLPAPGNDGLFVYGVDVLVASAGAPDLQGAFNFLDTVGSIDGQIAFNKLKNATPVRTDVDVSGFDSEMLGTIEDMRQAKYRMVIDWTYVLNDALMTFVTSKPHDKEALLQAVLAAR